MAEVSLGVEHKLANIVATEQEKNRVLARHGIASTEELQDKKGPDEKQIRRMLPANLGSDFRTHAKQHRQVLLTPCSSSCLHHLCALSTAH